MSQAIEALVAYKLIWFRVFCYFFIPFLGQFHLTFKDWDGIMWQTAYWFEIVLATIPAFVAGLLPLVAFYDSSYSKTRADYEARIQQKQKQTAGSGAI